MKLVTTHLKAKPVNEPTRVQQTNQLKSLFKPADANKVTIIAGDFNDTPDSKPI